MNCKLGFNLNNDICYFKGIDTQSMEQILSGLVQIGAWGCFDEFNRLDEATLSAVSMFIQQIQVALKTRKSKLTLAQSEVIYFKL